MVSPMSFTVGYQWSLNNVIPERPLLMLRLFPVPRKVIPNGCGEQYRDL